MIIDKWYKLSLDSDCTVGSQIIGEAPESYQLDAEVSKKYLLCAAKTIQKVPPGKYFLPHHEKATIEVQEGTRNWKYELTHDQADAVCPEQLFDLVKSMSGLTWW